MLFLLLDYRLRKLLMGKFMWHGYGAGLTSYSFQLLQTRPVVIEPGVWVGAFVFGEGEQIAPFQDIIVTAETGFPVLEPNLEGIVLIGFFEQCSPQ